MLFPFLKILERETRFELATPTLARLCSTTELFPLESAYYIHVMRLVNRSLQFCAKKQVSYASSRFKCFIGCAQIDAH